jgi:hypothetical protein
MDLRKEQLKQNMARVALRPSARYETQNEVCKVMHG